MRDPVLRHIVFPMLDVVTGCLGRFWFLNRLQWDRKGLQRWQDERIRTLVSHAYSTVPFYRQTFDTAKASPSDVRNPEDLLKLPIVSKRNLKRNFPDKTVSFAVSSRRMGLTNTSGTGEIFSFYNDKSTAGYAIASRLLFESWMGLRLGDRMAWLFNGPFSRRRRIRRMLTGLFTIPMFWLEGDPGAAVRIIRSVQPSALMGDLSILSSVANNIIRGGVDARMGLRATAPTAEVLLPNHRNLIARAFNCSVFNRYGLAEATGYVAQECNAHQGLHVNGGLVVVEVVKDGEPCGPGETGSIVLTNLHNYAMPFIRYDTGDLATVGDGCSCGRAFPVLARIEGRSPQWVLTESVPVALTGYLWTLQLTNFPISQCQFVQSKIGELTLLVAPKSALTTAQIAKLAKLLATVRPFVRVNVEAVDSIQPEASGKRVIFKPLRASA